MTPDQYREMRLALGMTQADLADQLGLPREAIVRREKGTQKITGEADIAIRALRAAAPIKRN
jgi:DNA-binding XRE family transcriptional regulator